MVITNFEAVNFLVKNQQLLTTFDNLVIDEFTAFKNKDAKRSKNIKTLSTLFGRRIGMSGTPNTNSILDLWHPVHLIDDGQHLGSRFYSYRHQVCTPQFNGFANVWTDKPGIEEVVANQLKDITIRHALEDCIDLPDNIVRTVYTTLSPQVAKMYKTLAEESVLYTKQGTINAVNAGARVKKLLQLGKQGISSIEKSMKGGKDHSFDKPKKGETVFYGRDRGEKGNSTSNWKDRDAVKFNSGEEYFYIWNE